MTSPSRRLCWSVVAIGAVGFALLAWWLVPWDWTPGGRLASVRSGDYFAQSQLHSLESYSSARRHLGWASYAVSLLTALVLGFSGLGRALTRRVRGPWPVRTVLISLAVLAIGQIAALPFAWIFRVRALSAGLTNQPVSGWWTDQGTTLALNVVFVSLAMLGLVTMARRLPRTWPLWGGIAAATFGFVVSYGYPMVVEPLFNHFTPMASSPIRTEILSLARTEHLPIKDVLVADASRRTTTLNAYVSGFGSSQRVVVYDNLLTDTPRREVMSVIAHELGHAKNHDVLHGTLLGALAAFAGVGLLGLLLGSERVRRRSGGGGAADPRMIPAVLALVAWGSLVAAPMQNTISRAVEARADRVALSTTRDPQAFIALQRELAVRSLSDPTPPAFSQFWFGTHPTTMQRIAMARWWELR